MLDKGIRVLNFDNSIIQQNKLLDKYSAQIIDLTDQAAAARLYMSATLRSKLSKLIPTENKYLLLSAQETSTILAKF